VRHLRARFRLAVFIAAHTVVQPGAFSLRRASGSSSRGAPRSSSDEAGLLNSAAQHEEAETGGNNPMDLRPGASCRIAACDDGIDVGVREHADIGWSFRLSPRNRPPWTLFQDNTSSGSSGWPAATASQARVRATAGAAVPVSSATSISRPLTAAITNLPPAAPAVAQVRRVVGLTAVAAIRAIVERILHRDLRPLQ
jgi:hypothetical protein